MSVDGFTSASLPTQESQLVLDERKALERSVKITLLVNDLRKLKKSMEMVRQAIVAHGNPRLQQNTKTMIDDMDALKAQSTHTFEEFHSQSKAALGKVQSVLDHLAQGETRESHADIAQILDIIRKLTASANVLSTKSNSAKEKVVGLIKEVGATLSSHQKQKEGYQQQQRDLQAKLVELGQQVKNAASAAEKAKREAEAAKAEALKQKKKLKKKKKGLFGLVGVAMDILDDGFNIELHKPYTKRREQAERQQKAFEAQETKQREFAKRAESQRAELNTKQQSIEQSIAKIATARDALSKASGEITELAAIAVDMTTFWKTMHQNCEDIAEITALAESDVSATADGTMKTDILQSRPFQAKTVNFYSKWMALNLLSSSYLQQINGAAPRDEL